MSVLTPKRIKLPEIITTPQNNFNSTQDSITIKMNKSVSEKSLYKTKPCFIAKKITDDDLYGDQSKLLNLSQIAEEEAFENGVSSPRDKDFSVSLDADGKSPKEQNHNIFKTEMLKSSKYKEHSKGPQYKGDSLIKHSIAGNVENFERYQKMLRRSKDAAQIQFDRDGSMSEISSHSKVQKPVTTYSYDAQNSFAGSSTPHSAMAKKLHSQKKTGESKKEIKISKEQLLDEIDKMSQRQGNYYLQEAMKLRTLQPGDALYHSKQSRAIEKFEETTHDWDRLQRLTCRKSGKFLKDSVYERSEDFRRKREIAETFEMAKTEPEKVGNIYWYMTLRKYDDKLPKEPFYEGDFPDAFQHTHFDRRASVLEVIRKKNDAFSSTFSDASPNSIMSKSIGRTEREYLDTKYKQNEKYIKKIKVPFPEEASQLSLFGHNKLKREIDAVLKNNERKETFWVPKNFFDKNKEQQQLDEIIHEDKDNVSIFRNGLSAFLA